MPLISAAGFEVEITPIKDAITENQAAVVEVKITNNDKSSLFDIFTVNTDFIFAGKVVKVLNGQSETKEIKIFPQIDRSGLYRVNIFVKSQATSEIVEGSTIIRLAPLKDSLSITVKPDPLSVKDMTITVVFKNTAEVNVGTVRIEAESPIFSDEFEFSLAPKEEQSFDVDVDLTKAEGGEHPINMKVYEEGKFVFEKDVPYRLEEIKDFEESRSITGFLIREKVLTFENDGNIKEKVEVEEDSTFLEKIFSYFSEKPLFKTEAGALKATWSLEVQPYSTKEIIVKTNYLLPLTLLALIIIGFAFTVRYQSTGLIVTKSASRAKSNKGTAFKVTIKVRNRKDAVRELRVKDFLPKHLKVHEKFDFTKPSKVTDSYVEWFLPLLQGGEERVFTYYLYTEGDYTGSLVLPHTAVNYLTLHRDPASERSGTARIEALKVGK